MSIITRRRRMGASLAAAGLAVMGSGVAMAVSGPASAADVETCDQAGYHKLDSATGTDVPVPPGDPIGTLTWGGHQVTFDPAGDGTLLLCVKAGTHTVTGVVLSEASPTYTFDVQQGISHIGWLPGPTPSPSSPSPSSPAPSSPAPSSPAPSSPAPSSPAPSSPAPSSPAPSTPAASSPAPSSPAPSTPAPSSPAPSTPAPSTPVVPTQVATTLPTSSTGVQVSAAGEQAQGQQGGETETQAESAGEEEAVEVLGAQAQSQGEQAQQAQQAQGEQTAAVPTRIAAGVPGESLVGSHSADDDAMAGALIGLGAAAAAVGVLMALGRRRGQASV